jgi:uncharacterized protein (TIGR03085 family)
MTSLAAHERTLLCALAQQVGPEAPTLCGGWDVRDLVIHLLVREGHPLAAAGIFVPPLAGVRRRTEDKLARRDFADLVTALRHGPPLLSPFSFPRLGEVANTAEFFVHHEDIRRAQPDWSPRVLRGEAEDLIWRLLGLLGRGTALVAPTGVVMFRSDVAGARKRLRPAPAGAGDVEVTGPPSELMLFAYGRQEHAVVDLSGEPDDVAALRGASLGI